MTKGLKLIAVVLFLGQAGTVFAGTALSQLPGIDKAADQLPQSAPKASSVWVNFSVDNFSKTSFSFNDYSQDIQITGYKDFEDNVRFSGMVGQESVSGSFTRNFNEQVFNFEMGATKLTVQRYAINYKVTGVAAGANGALTPVNLVIRGGIRERAYGVSDAGLDMTASNYGISGTVDPSVDKKFVTAIAAIMASLRTDDILGVLDVAANFPNPFLPGNGTTLTYTLLQSADYVNITVYDMYGKVITTMQGGTMKGVNNVMWDGRDPNNSSYMGRKIYIWQLEITLPGYPDKAIKQFTMNAANN